MSTGHRRGRAGNATTTSTTGGRSGPRATHRPASGESMIRAATKKPTAKKPARKKPAAKKPATKKPATKKPARKKPAAKKPAAKKPARKRPARKKPTAKKPAAAAAVAAAKKLQAAAKKRAAAAKRATAAAKRSLAKKVAAAGKSLEGTLARPQHARASTAAATGTPVVKPPFKAYGGAKAYLFVSYSHRNTREVFQVLAKLRASRYRIWYDEGIEPGAEWPEVIGKAVFGCTTMLVFMSRSASESRNVRNEINLAYSEGKDIQVVFLEDTTLTEGLQLQIGTVQSIYKHELSQAEFYQRLVTGLGPATRT